MPNFMRKRDALTILIILFAGACMWIFYSISNTGKAGLYGEIYLDGILIETVSLDKNTSFSVSEVPAVEFEVYNHTVAFANSDCPDKVCISSGRLSKSGDFAACLPNKLTLQVKSRKPDSGDGNDIVVK